MFDQAAVPLANQIPYSLVLLLHHSGSWKTAHGRLIAQLIWVLMRMDNMAHALVDKQHTRSQGRGLLAYTYVYASRS